MKVSGVNHARWRCVGKFRHQDRHLLLRLRARERDEEVRVAESGSYLGISYSSTAASRKVFQVSSAICRWSWWWSCRRWVRTRSGADRAFSPSKTSFRSLNSAGKNPSRKRCVSTSTGPRPGGTAPPPRAPPPRARGPPPRTPPSAPPPPGGAPDRWRTVPPQPISISSECAPSTSNLGARSAGSPAKGTAWQISRPPPPAPPRAELGAGTAAATQPVLRRPPESCAPQLPRCRPPRQHPLELAQVLEVSQRAPEPVIAVRE